VEDFVLVKYCWLWIVVMIPINRFYKAVNKTLGRSFVSRTVKLTHHQNTFPPLGLVAWCSGNALCPINKVALCWAGLVTSMSDCLRAGKPSRHVTGRLRQGAFTCVGWQTLCDLIWQVKLC